MNKVEDSTIKLLETEQSKRIKVFKIVKDYENNSWKDKLKNFFVLPIQKCRRIIYLNGKCIPIN